MKTTSKLFFFILILCSLVSCKKDDLIPIDYSDSTVIVYMADDNNLGRDQYSKNNLESIMKGVSNNPSMGNLLVYIEHEQPTVNNPQLLKITKGANGQAVKEIIRTYPIQNSVSPTVMGSILCDIKMRFVSKNYGLILWSHGMGWFPGAGNTKTKYFGVDGNYQMEISELCTALKQGPYFNYIAFDACFMAGIETAYALKDYSDYLIASPAEILGDGFPYDKILPYMFGKTENDYIKLADTFYNHYNGKQYNNQSGAICCIKNSAVVNLATETSKIIKAHTDKLNGFVASGMQYYDDHIPRRFYDFGYFIENISTTEELTNFNRQLAKTIVYKNCTPEITSVVRGIVTRIPINHFSGLNCFIPQASTASYNRSYKTSEWYNAVGWNLTSW